MKICYFANASSIHTQRWIKYFSERGHEVHIISFEKPDVELNGINIHILNTNKKYLFISFPYIAFQFRTIIKKIKPDIVHAHFITKYGIIAALTGFLPLVLTAWGALSLKSLKGPHKFLTQYTLNRADLITIDGENTREILTKLGADTQKMKFIYFGTDTQKFDIGIKSEKLREDLKIYDSPTVISLRNFEPLYDIESLIEAVPLVLNELPDTKFIIAGRGSLEAELKELARSLGVSDSTRFIGHIPNDELPEYITLADIYVSTSTSDAGLAASTSEAMACGLPVIITDFGDNNIWVENNVNGFLIPLNDPESLTDKIIYLLNNPDVRKEFGKRNRMIIEEKNNYHKVMEKMENIYMDLIKRY